MLANVQLIIVRAIIFLLSGSICTPSNSIYRNFAKKLKVRFLKRHLFFCFLLCFPVYTFCWGVLGHRIVGEIAESYLTPKAKAEIKKIFGDTTVAIASAWGDFIRSDSSYAYLDSWHYINLDSGLTRRQVQSYLDSDTATDIYTKTRFLIKELKNKQLPVSKKKMYLKLLIHFVGDIHQPLHVGRKVDLGGNRVRVQWFNNATNLHAVWDESLVNFQQLSYTEYTRTINFTTQSQRLAWQKQPISEWVIESYIITQKLYSEITAPNQRLSYNYNFDHIKTVNERLLKGGVRLAGLLNEIFG